VYLLENLKHTVCASLAVPH